MKRGRDKKTDHPIVLEKVNKSLKLSIKEGSIHDFSSSLDMSYFSPFALAMNATSSQIGILRTVINLFQSITQLSAPRFVGRFSRKRFVIFTKLARMFVLLLIILTGFMFYKGVSFSIWILIFLVGLFYAFVAASHPVWFSWMGSLVSESERGKYFSKRNRIVGFFGLTGMVMGAVILDFFKDKGLSYGNALAYTLFGFGVLFSLAFLFKIWSLLLLAKQYEPSLKVRKKDYFSFWQFFRKTPSNSFGRFVLFRGGMSLAFGISSPFLAVYMLRNLDFSYVWFMAVTVSEIAFRLVFLPFLGKFSDRFGNVKLMKICSYFIFMVPFVWFFSSFIENALAVRIYLLIIPGIIGGFGWAGYLLASNNYVYDAVSGRKVEYGDYYMELVVGIGSFIGALIGSGIAYVGVSFMEPLLFIFLVSGFSRMAATFIGGRYLKEVRDVKRFSSRFIFREIMPVNSFSREFHYLGHFVNNVNHYV